MTNDPKVKKVKLSELIPDPKNANKGTERGRYMLEHSITNLGAGRSVLVDKNNVLIAGNKTAEVAVESGFEDAIVVETDGTELVVVKRKDLDLTSDDKAKQLAIADNRVGQINLNFDAEVILELDQEIDLSTYFTDIELNDLSVSLDEEEKGDRSKNNSSDDIPEVVESRVKFGEIWKLGRHYICCSDSTVEENVRKLLGFVGRRSPDICFSDPPYGINFDPTKDRTKPFGSASSQGKKPIKSISRPPVIGDDSVDTAVSAYEIYKNIALVHIWWGANYYAHALPPSSCWIVWDKENSGDFADCELAWTNQKSAVRIFRHMWNGALKDSERGEKRVHGTQKPVALAEWCFEKYGKTDDLILDPFWGSGISTLAAEKMLGQRTVLAFELSEINCELGIRRWEQLSGEKAQLVSSV